MNNYSLIKYSIIFYFQFFIIFIQPSVLKEKIETLINKTNSYTNYHPHIGIEIFSLDENKEIFKFNNEDLFIPASNTKIITAAAAFHYLGPNYKFNTTILTDGEIIKKNDYKILKGNIYIKGQGDPSLKSKTLSKFVELIAQHGIKKIDGNLCIDNSEFDNKYFGPGYAWDDGANDPDNAPVDALSVNYNLIKVCISPNKSKNSKAICTTIPETNFVKINNEAITDEQLMDIEVSRRWQELQNIIDITGKINIDNLRITRVLTVEYPHLYAGTLLLETLKEKNIVLTGTIKVCRTPEKAKIVIQHKSKPLKHLMTRMMKKSDNLYANAFFKAIGAKVYGKPGTFSKGSKAINSFLLNTVKIPKDTFVIVDGAGLSRYNLISPNCLIKILNWIENSNYKKDYINSLTICGIDGTLNDRMHDIKGKIYGKTGTLGGISGITSCSGFATDKNGKRYLFSIIMNAFIKNDKKINYKTKFEDELLRILCTN